jgi:hypothetical protein
MLPNSSSPSYDGDIIGSILVGTRLEWIPCESDNGVIGYYERVKGNFIAPTGDGTPVSLGYDNSHLVRDVVGNHETLTVGKNLFSQDSYLDAYCSAGGIITAHNTSRCFVMECKPNTEYRFVFDNSEVSSPRCVISGFATQPEIGMRGTQVCYSSSNTDARRHDVTFTTDSDINYLVMWLAYQKSDSTTKAAIDKAVFIETATSQTVSVANLYAVGDYKDEKNIVTGAVTRRVGVRVLDGTETWGQKNATDGRIIMRLNDAINQASAPIIVTHGRWSTSSVKDSDEWRLLTGPYLCCYSSLETTDDFKARLAAQYAAGNPYIVIYPLAEEQIEQVDPQPIIANDGDNVIIVSSAVGEVELKVEYLGVE